MEDVWFSVKSENIEEMKNVMDAIWDVSYDKDWGTGSLTGWIKCQDPHKGIESICKAGLQEAFKLVFAYTKWDGDIYENIEINLFHQENDVQVVVETYKDGLLYQTPNKITYNRSGKKLKEPVYGNYKINY